MSDHETAGKFGAFMSPTAADAMTIRDLRAELSRLKGAEGAAFLAGFAAAIWLAEDASYMGGDAAACFIEEDSAPALASWMSKPRP
tara:strand:+ start:493 stop:750 length:258 start_codon:yes stop_codon:yes gene_type:complete